MISENTITTISGQIRNSRIIAWLGVIHYNNIIYIVYVRVPILVVSLFSNKVMVEERSEGFC